MLSGLWQHTQCDEQLCDNPGLLAALRALCLRGNQQMLGGSTVYLKST